MAKSAASKRQKKQGNTKLLATLWRPVRAVLRIVLRPFRPLLRPAVRYLRGVRQEFKRVNWPPRNVAWRLTAAVIGFSIVFAALVAVMDYGLNILFEKVIVKG